MSDAAEHIGTSREVELRRLRLALQASGGVFYDWDLASNRIAWSEGAAAAFGVGSAAAIATAAEFQSRIGPDDRPVRALALAKHLNERQPFDCTYKLRRDDGQFEWVHEAGVAERGSTGEPRHMVGIIRLITGSKTQRDRLERLAHHDDLTGQLNRSGLQKELEAMLRAAAAGGDYPSLLVVNIDNLGAINDSYGYEIADAAIVEIGRRTRKALCAGDRLGRIAGNQFGAVLEGRAPIRMAPVADAILKAVRGSAVETAAGPIAVTVSIGGVALDAATSTFQAAVGCAEEALERAKQAGRDRFVSYSLAPEQAGRRRTALTTGERVLSALRDDRLKLAFQPIVDARSGEAVMYECLLRMIDDAGAVLDAGQFMPAVERLGLVRLIDRRTLELALRELERHDRIRLAVNVSAFSAADPTALMELVNLVEAHRPLAGRLTFEITETVAMTDFDESARFATMLKSLGCSVAVDDFGAGYTSFRHLKDLAVDMVKIDGQFIQDLSRNPDNQLFVDTLLKLAQGLGLATVAECVETEADARILGERGVSLLQGYLFGRPVLEPPWRARAVRAGRRNTVS